ncbi:SAM-dependent DNA methyltransferase, partial [Candidatus Gracilibacteria bacterium]|nr:SAM-dependent DNA methyltransferase [Candidatus Gracilibacteria bacterium]
SVIKAIQDIMRKDQGVDGDAQRLSQIVWMLFLKIFDDMEKQGELMNPKYKSPIPEELRWKNWAANPEGITGEKLLDFVNEKLFKKLKSLNYTINDNAQGFIVQEVFEDTYNYMKNGTLIRQVINKLNEVDFNSSEDRHMFGDVYEHLLASLQSAGNAGEYYTPRPLTNFVVEMVNPKLGEKILDPACGTGGFLTSTIEHIRKSVKTAEKEELIKKTVRGVELKPLPHMLCVTNMILHGIQAPTNITHDDALSRPLKDYAAADKVDAIITNPPFGGTVADGVLANIPHAYRTSETADLFLVLIVKLLKDGGRGGIVLPDGSLFGEGGIKERIKEMFLTECNLHTIVRLPKGVFSPYTDIETNLLFFTKGEPTEEIWYYEHPLPVGRKTYTKTMPIRYEEFDAERKWWNKRTEGDNAWKVPFALIRERNFNLDIKNPRKVVQDEDLKTDKILEELGESLKRSSTIVQELKDLISSVS